MTLLWSIVIGFMVGLFPCIGLLALFGSSRFLWISHPYAKGAAIGFACFVLAGVIMHTDLRYGFIGFMHRQESGSLLALYPDSIYGFITSGIAVAYFRETMDILKKKQAQKKQR